MRLSTRKLPQSTKGISMKPRGNQKNRRRNRKREVGVFSKNGQLRVVELHPTKGYREQNGEAWRAQFEEARRKEQAVKLQRGKNETVIQPVKSNVPHVRHNRSG